MIKEPILITTKTVAQCPKTFFGEATNKLHISLVLIVEIRSRKLETQGFVMTDELINLITEARYGDVDGCRSD